MAKDRYSYPFQDREIMLAERINEQINDLALAFAPPKQTAMFDRRFNTRAEAYEWWKRVRFTEHGTKALQFYTDQQKMELDLWLGEMEGQELSQEEFGGYGA